MAIQPGRRLGPYEILSAIGAGGMGEVYRARDTRLDRIVAIKVLHAHLADQSDLRERFEREARTIASLNHPHISVLHDIGSHDGIDFLVLEYVEGESLSARLSRGRLPLAQVLASAIEIADALDRAHHQGITHRDIKPSNIMMTKSGTKLLDFGLAKLKQEVAPTVPLSRLGTEDQSALTAQGAILGTYQYMAPEQVEAKEVDARTDIFAFGAVVYEMATGKCAFEGKTQASIMAKILESEPAPMPALQPMTPPALDRVIRKCLAKDPDKRWQAASDVCDELRWILESNSQAAAGSAANTGPRKRWARLAWSLGLLAVLILAATAATPYFRPLPAELAPVRFSIAPPNQGNFAIPPSFLALSPDGRMLALVASDAAGKSQLWIRSLDSAFAQPLPGTENASQPFWSGDSRHLAFLAAGKLQRISVSGGPSQTIVDGSSSPASSGSWSREGVVLFSSAAPSTIHRVSAAGGVVSPVTSLDMSREENGHFSPSFLPDGNHFVFFARSVKPENDAIYVGSLSSKERRLLLRATSNVQYVPPRYLLFHRAGTLMVQPFDASRLELSGEAVPIAERVQFGGTVSRGAFAASDNGVLAYRSGYESDPRTLVWVSRNGTEQPLRAPQRAYQQPRLSPDGTRVAVQIEEQGNQIWLYELGRETLTRLTFDASQNETPIWTPDSKRVVFYSNKEGPLNLFWQMADGSGGFERLTTSANAHAPGSVSSDGALLAFTEAPGGSRDIWVLRLSDRTAQPFIQTPAIEGAAQFSPDGRWMAYVSNESGRPEIYVQPYPGPGGKWQVSTERGGQEPVWNRNGRELFYRSGNRMMAVDIATRPAFTAGRPQMLFDRSYVSNQLPQTLPVYDVSPDGQRFLMVKEGERPAAPPVEVVVNWTEHLKRQMTTGGR